MITFTNTVRIDRPAADIYAYLSDLENMPEWNWAITETTKITQGSIALGTRYRQTRRVPRPATEILQITDLDADRHLEIQGTVAAMAARLRYDLTEIEGETELANTVDLEPRGALRLAGPILGTRIEKAVASNLRDLKTRLETTVRQQTSPPR